MRKMLLLSLLVALALALFGCGQSANGNGGALNVDPATPESPAPIASPSTALGSEPDEAETPPAEPAPSPTPEDPEAKLLHAADEVVDALRERDLNRLRGWIDPTQGLRFSPYPHIDTAAALQFQADALPDFADATKLTWGVADGSGEPIELSFRDYYDRYVYDQDYMDAPDINANELKGHGNSPYNGGEVYPGSSYVEYHFSGFDKQYEGMDWRSLMLVFVPSGDDWKLVAIVHGEWTI